jgi:hypothetical protein
MLTEVIRDGMPYYELKIQVIEYQSNFDIETGQTIYTPSVSQTVRYKGESNEINIAFNKIKDLASSNAVWT